MNRKLIMEFECDHGCVYLFEIKVLRKYERTQWSYGGKPISVKQISRYGVTWSAPGNGFHVIESEEQGEYKPGTELPHYTLAGASQKFHRICKEMSKGVIVCSNKPK